MLATRERGILESVYGTDAVHSIVPQYQPPQNNSYPPCSAAPGDHAKAATPLLRANPGSGLTAGKDTRDIISWTKRSYVNVNPEP